MAGSVLSPCSPNSTCSFAFHAASSLALSSSSSSSRRRMALAAACTVCSATGTDFLNRATRLPRPLTGLELSATFTPSASHWPTWRWASTSRPLASSSGLPAAALRSSSLCSCSLIASSLAMASAATESALRADMARVVRATALDNLPTLETKSSTSSAPPRLDESSPLRLLSKMLFASFASRDATHAAASMAVASSSGLPASSLRSSSCARSFIASCISAAFAMSTLRSRFATASRAASTSASHLVTSAWSFCWACGPSPTACCTLEHALTLVRAASTRPLVASLGLPTALLRASASRNDVSALWMRSTRSLLLAASHEATADLAADMALAAASVWSRRRATISGVVFLVRTACLSSSATTSASSASSMARWARAFSIWLSPYRAFSAVSSARAVVSVEMASTTMPSSRIATAPAARDTRSAHFATSARNWPASSALRTLAWASAASTLLRAAFTHAVVSSCGAPSTLFRVSSSASSFFSSSSCWRGTSTLAASRPSNACVARATQSGTGFIAFHMLFTSFGVACLLRRSLRARLAALTRLWAMWMAWLASSSGLPAFSFVSSKRASWDDMAPSSDTMSTTRASSRARTASAASPSDVSARSSCACSSAAASSSTSLEPALSTASLMAALAALTSRRAAFTRPVASSSGASTASLRSSVATRRFLRSLARRVRARSTPCLDASARSSIRAAAASTFSAAAADEASISLTGPPTAGDVTVSFANVRPVVTSSPASDSAAVALSSGLLARLLAATSSKYRAWLACSDALARSISSRSSMLRSLMTCSMLSTDAVSLVTHVMKYRPLDPGGCGSVSKPASPAFMAASWASASASSAAAASSLCAPAPALACKSFTRRDSVSSFFLALATSVAWRLATSCAAWSTAEL